MSDRHAVLKQTLGALRNAVGHEYPDPDAITDILNGIRSETPEVLGVMHRLRVAAARLAGDGEAP
jgi:hypothetical protein